MYLLKGDLGKERSICVLKGSSVNLTCFPENSAPSKSWYTVMENNSVFFLKDFSANVTYNITEDGTLTIREVKKSEDYCCQDSNGIPKQCWENRIELHVAGTDNALLILKHTEWLI